VSDAGAVVRMAFEESPVALLAVDRHGTVVAVNRHARALFGLGLDSPGSVLEDLPFSRRPVELRPLVDEVTTTRRPVTVPDVKWTSPSGELEYLDVSVLPLSGDGQGVVVSYVPVGRYKQLRDDLERSQRELESAYVELQSTVEELETTNEELQSTNEELETTNEELHSTNEELEAANGELRQRGAALDQVNGFLESILSSLASGVVVLDRDLAVRAWNAVAEDAWGLRADEVEGSHFLNLDIGLPVDRLRAPVRQCLGGGSPGEDVRLPALNRRGRAVDCLVRVSPLRAHGEVSGVILVMDALQA
jgi:two-component system CheB/CheR fusion protein